MKLKTTATALFSAAIISTAFAGTNLLTNGDFSSGTSGWTVQDNESWYTGTASTNFTVSGGEATISPTALGQYEWESNIYQEGITLEQGKTYRCTFDVRLVDASAGYRPITLSIKADYNNVGDIQYFGCYAFPISNETQSFTFTMPFATDDNSKLSIIYGENMKNFILDNISLTEISDGFLPEIDLYAVPYNITFSNPSFGFIGRDDSGIREYRYSVDGGSEVTTTETNVTVSGLGDGSHTFTVYPVSNTGEIGGSATSYFNVSGVGSVSAMPTRATRGVATTAFTNESGLQINTAADEAISVSITNAQGRVVFSSEQMPVNNVISISRSSLGLASGVYLLNLSTNSASVISSKISL